MIADEPTTALDVTTQHEILLLLRELVDEFDISLLFVTHDLGVVAELCDTVCVIYAGQTVEAGPVDAVLQTPVHPYTRRCWPAIPERDDALRRHSRHGAVGAADADGMPLRAALRATSSRFAPTPCRTPAGCRPAPASGASARHEQRSDP